MPNDFISFIILAALAVVVLWLVFFVVRKLFGVALLIALAVGAWMVWNDPDHLRQWADPVMNFFDRYV